MDLEKYFNWVTISIGAVGGFLATALGGWDKWLMALLVFAIVDYITGLIKGAYTKQLSSEIGWKGIIKKIYIFLLIAIAHIMQSTFGNALPLRDMTIMFFIANEGLSLVENIAVFIPIPEKIKDTLLQLREKNNIENGEIEHE